MNKTTVVHCCGDKTSHGDYVYIGRPSIFGNPFAIGKDGSREDVINSYRAELYNNPSAHWEAVRAEARKLKSKVLGCWCKPHACHGDVLAEFAEKCK